MIVYNQVLHRFESTLVSRLPDVIAGFTHRSVGDCRHITSILSHWKAIDVPYRKVALLEQIHSVNVASTNLACKTECEQIAESDGVVSFERGTYLVVRTADCVPCLYVDPVSRIIGASHQGWRGTAKHMAQAVVHAMCRKGAKPERIYAVLGPAINMCCYLIDADRYAECMETLERFEKVGFRRQGMQFGMNLIRLNYEQLIETGVPASQIDYFPFCTSCDTDRFFSFRREYKKTPQLFGEMMGYIMLTV